jgi:raffinose/stachyose/melibiose transport system substrate-binding protein
LEEEDMQRRTFIHGSLGVFAASLLSSTAFSQDKKPITWWYETAAPENKEYLKTLLIDPFNTANPAEELSIDFRGAELDKQLRVAMLSGSGPDVVYTAGPSYVASMAQAGQLLPLDDYAQKLGWSDRILPVFIELGKYNGKLYALPKTYETLGLFFNKTLFDANGWTAPKTIAELETLADAMKAKGLVPFAAGNADWRPTNEHYVSIILNSVAGPENVYKALIGELPWTAEPFVRAIDTLNKWWQAGYFGPNYFSLTGEQAFAQVATGQAGMAPTGTWNFQNVARYFPANNAEPAFVGFPSGDGIPYPIYALGIGSTFSIAATSQNPDGAAAVIDYVFSDKFYGDMNTVWQGEWNTPLRDLSKVKLGDTVLPLYSEAMKALAASVDANQYGYTTWTFLPPATDTYLVSGMEEVWLGKSTTQQFLETLDATFKQEQAEGKVPAIPAR